ncbi:hypothetical protein [Streptobacillus moniliformis]|uniref:hypothetical protein n=1 Tax=Streptobacillus moniliformis TaxID=34105 RepID=UPI0007E4B0D3|nr:hypothetical protein [Streptobacillus moniliformis]
MKKLFLMMSFVGLISFSNNIVGPRYRIEGALGFLSSKEADRIKNRAFISNSISVLPEWKAQINKKIDITFGPKLTLNVGSSTVHQLSTIKPNLALGIEVDFNYRIKEKIKIYGGVEIGTGIGTSITYIPKGKNLTNNGPTLKLDKAILTTIGKMSVGVKINDKYNVGIYMGNIKGMLGLEAGYTFK